MKHSTLSRSKSSRRRAAVAVITAVTLVVLLMFASLTIDLGFVHSVCGDMQHTADSAALAGASALRSVDDANIEAVTERVRDIIERMQKSQGFDAPDDQIIEVGVWNSKTSEFEPLDATVRSPFAVRVVSVRKNTPLFFASVMGKHSTSVTREAVAIGSPRCGGIWGLRGIRVNGSVVTDSYDSTTGPYSATTAGDQGDLCSGRDIRISGSATINGDTLCGFGYEVEVNGRAAEITGMTTANTSPIIDPPLDFGDIKYVNDNGAIGLTDKGKSPFKGGPGNIFVNANDNLTILPGEYYFNSIAMHSGSSIMVTGKTTIYVGGNVKAAGGGVLNETANPGDLSIISAGSRFEIGGSYDFYGSVFAPNADVKLFGDSQWYGALVGGTVWLHGNVEFHVDESLPELNFIEAPQPYLVH